MEWLLALKNYLLLNWGKLSWKSFRDFIIEQLKGAAVKAALIKFFGTTVGLGVKGWIVKVAVKTFYKEIGEPIAKAVFVEMGYKYEQVKSEVFLRKLSKAEQENSQIDYDAAVDGAIR